MNADLKRALIIGVTGQDGSYLAELLLAKGYVVHGVRRRASTYNTSRIDHLIASSDYVDRFVLHYGDVTDATNVLNVIRTVRPDEIYNLAAQSHVAISFEEPSYTANVDAIGTLNILEAIKTLDLHTTRFYQASTSELFGEVREIPQTEATPFYPRSPYGVAKLYGFWITVNYREAYGLYACNGILFNHESPRRGENFVTRKITMGLAAVKRGYREKISVGNLNALRDWGHAKDYVELMWLMLQASKPKDYVAATGVQYSVRDFINEVCKHLELEIRWSGSGLEEKATLGDGSVIVDVNPKYFRPSEVETLLGDSTLARQDLGWRPKYKFDDLVKEMVEHDLAALDQGVK